MNATMQAMQRRTMTLPTVAGRAGGGADASVTISTNNVDRYGDVVVPQGARLDAFRANPVLLFAHDAGGIPVGTVTEVQVTPDALRASWRWLKNDDDAARVRNAWDQGALRAASIGFLPIRWEPNDTEGNTILEWELLEISIVPIPANRESVRLMKSIRRARAVDPAAFARRLAGDIIAVLAAQRQQLAPGARAGGILLVDDGRSRRASVTASELSATIRSAFASARRR